MKITKRRQPVDFQSMTEEPAAAVAAPAVEPAPEADEDLDLTLSEPPAAAVEPPPFVPPVEAPKSNLSDVRRSAPAAVTAPPVAAYEEPVGDGRRIWAVALVLSILWAIGPIAFAWGYRRDVMPFQNDAFALFVLGMLALGPAVLVWVAAYVVRQGQRLAVETRRAKRLADELVSPALLAGARTGDVVQGVRDEIVRAGQAAEEARETLLALRQALALESERLVAAAAESVRTASGLTQSLGTERTELASLAVTLDTQSAAVADAIAKQAKMVAEASDLAETQLREAEALLAARAADLAAAAGETSDAARAAAEDLTRHIARLETAGVGVAEQISAVEAGLSEQRAGLVTVAHGLRADQEAFAAQAETNVAQLAEFITQARLSTAELGDRAARGGEALRQMIADAADQFRELAETARAERDEFGQSTLYSIEQVSDAAAQERARLEAQTRQAIESLHRAAEETRAAAERHAEAARAQVDQLSEAAFTAGQHANKVFEARLEEARGLIEHSAKLVENAGDATARRLEEGALRARATLEELTAMLADVEARAARLPTTARDQAEHVRQAVADSIDELMDHARKTAEETQAIDDAFQERVRRNYEMLSEAVRLMGSVAGHGAALTAPQLRERAPAPTPAPTPKPAPPPVRAPAPVRTAAAEDDDLELTVPAAPERSAPKPARGGRLRLTPTASDQEFKAVFGEAAGRPAPDADDEEPTEEWTWKDLLSSLEEEERPHAEPVHLRQSEPEPVDDLDLLDDEPQDALEDVLAAEVTGMGIDPTALLPRSRIDEIAAAIQARDLEAARDVVRRLAPAATRRLSRRLFTDDGLKRQVARYLANYQDLLRDAADRDRFLVGTLLGSDAGRIFLLFDAAAGDLV